MVRGHVICLYCHEYDLATAHVAQSLTHPTSEEDVVIHGPVVNESGPNVQI
jgi:hypothetical protein